jgi:hypothetical protein
MTTGMEIYGDVEDSRFKRVTRRSSTVVYVVGTRLTQGRVS